MSKRTIILTQRQLDEIVGGGNSPYLDGDDSSDSTNHISTDGSSKKTHTTGDEYSSTLPRYSYSYFNGGMGVGVLREANQDLVNNRFGAGTDIHTGETYEGDTYENAKKKVWRKNEAEKTMQTGATPEIKAKAAQTLNNMQKNSPNDLTILQNQYENAKNVSQQQKEKKKQNGERILKSAPKTGVGTAHSIKTNNGFITYK